MKLISRYRKFNLMILVVIGILTAIIGIVVGTFNEPSGLYIALTGIAILATAWVILLIRIMTNR